MKAEKKHIVYVITRSEHGGAQTHVLSLIKSFVGEYKITLITGEHGFLEQQLRELGVKVHVLPALQRKVSLVYDFKAYFELKKCLKTFRPDLIHLHSTKAGIIGRLVARSNYKTAFTAHGWCFSEGAPKHRILLGQIVEKTLSRWADRIITVSRADYNEACRFKIAPESKLSQIYNGIELPETPPVNHQIGNRPVKLVMVARLVEQKDHFALLDALKTVDIPCKLDIVGDGPKYSQISQAIQQNKLQENVRLLGARNDITRILSESDIFVLSTNWEGFPISILEAMSLGLPVIATDVGGIKEQVIHNQTGFLVKPNNPEMLAKYISTLVCDKVLRKKFGASGYELVKNRFNLEQMTTKTQVVYASLLAS